MLKFQIIKNNNKEMEQFDKHTIAQIGPDAMGLNSYASKVSYKSTDGTKSFNLYATANAVGQANEIVSKLRSRVKKSHNFHFIFMDGDKVLESCTYQMYCNIKDLKTMLTHDGHNIEKIMLGLEKSIKFNEFYTQSKCAKIISLSKPRKTIGETKDQNPYFNTVIYFYK